jgi:phosphotriesterase-related protein
MADLITTLGRLHREDVGLILPHEHIFVDLGPIEEAHWRHARAEDVIPVVGPEIEAAQAAGVTVLVECTPEGVGRRIDIDKAVSDATGLPVVVPTGIYREPWVPEWAQSASEDELNTWMLNELTDEVQGTGVSAAWIKVSAGDDGITETETKILRAAARAGKATNAVIGSHTIRGTVVRDQLDIIEARGYSADRFIWIHTQAEPDFGLHLEMAERGVWIEYDAIGSDNLSDERFLELILKMLEAGFVDQLLLSHDRGWYDPSKPGGGTVKPYTYLSEVFLPKLRAAGVDADTVRKLTQDNPFAAFAR